MFSSSSKMEFLNCAESIDKENIDKYFLCLIAYKKKVLLRAHCKDGNSRVQTSQSLGCWLSLISYTSSWGTYIIIYCNTFTTQRHSVQ